MVWSVQNARFRKHKATLNGKRSRVLKSKIKDHKSEIWGCNLFPLPYSPFFLLPDLHRRVLPGNNSSDAPFLVQLTFIFCFLSSFCPFFVTLTRKQSARLTLSPWI